MPGPNGLDLAVGEGGVSEAASSGFSSGVVHERGRGHPGHRILLSPQTELSALLGILGVLLRPCLSLQHPCSCSLLTRSALCLCSVEAAWGGHCCTEGQARAVSWGIQEAWLLLLVLGLPVSVGMVCVQRMRTCVHGAAGCVACFSHAGLADTLESTV